MKLLLLFYSISISSLLSQARINFLNTERLSIVDNHNSKKLSYNSKKIKFEESYSLKIYFKNFGKDSLKLLEKENSSGIKRISTNQLKKDSSYVLIEMYSTKKHFIDSLILLTNNKLQKYILINLDINSITEVSKIYKKKYHIDFGEILFLNSKKLEFIINSENNSTSNLELIHNNFVLNRHHRNINFKTDSNTNSTLISIEMINLHGNVGEIVDTILIDCNYADKEPVTIIAHMSFIGYPKKKKVDFENTSYFYKNNVLVKCEDTNYDDKVIGHFIFKDGHYSRYEKSN